ncbi:hypothetical protein KAJ27_11355 [bacterium]|nr:hypothetical protein [bacterium]
MRETELSVRDVLLYFLETYIRDRILTPREKDNIVRLKQLLNLETKKYLDIMGEVKARFVKGEIQYVKDTPKNDDIKIFTMVLEKAYRDSEVSKAESELIQIVGDILDLSQQERDVMIEKYNIVTKKNDEESLTPEMFESETVIFDDEGVRLDSETVRLDDNQFTDDDIVILLDSP